ncbi:MAG TPA: rhomboid family intramembrane serine protease [Nocardioides sp.]
MWRPFSSLFVHPGGVAHLGINSGLLLLVGPIAEPMLGRRRFIGTYLLGGTATNALRYLMGGREGGGASAAICAVAGAAVARRARHPGDDNGTAVRTAAAIVTVAGLGVARRTGDNHILALGIGALAPVSDVH